MNARLPLSTLSQRARDALLDAFPHAAAVYLFGSAARGAARHDSDVDLAVLLPERVASSELFDVQRNVSVAIDADVDLIDLSVASTVLQCEVITRGQRIFERDHDHVLDFEARVLSEYGALLEATQSLRESMRDRLAAGR
jgi:predicted nucleotidyltransferase